MKVIVAGDFCQHHRVNDLIQSGQYNKLFDNVKSRITSADYSIVNFEFPIVTDVNKVKSIYKCGPALKGTRTSVDAIKYAGFDCCTLANNHILDQGETCCIETLQILQDAGLDTVGAGKNLDSAGEILYKKIGTETLAVINCCEHEFSIATQETAGANPLNPVKQYYKIKEAREKADYVLVIIHGGHEHYQLPSIRMKETYQFFIDQGADAVVNHHQHCFSGYEVYKGRPIFYGLGNFCFDWPGKNNLPWNEGFWVEFDFNKNKGVGYTITPFVQCDTEVGVFPISDESDFQRRLTEFNKIIASDAALAIDNNNYYRTESKSVFERYEPLRFLRLTRRLFEYGLLPNLRTKTQILEIWNYMACESHRDKQLSIFKDWRKTL